MVRIVEISIGSIVADTQLYTPNYSWKATVLILYKNVYLIFNNNNQNYNFKTVHFYFRHSDNTFIC